MWIRIKRELANGKSVLGSNCRSAYSLANSNNSILNNRPTVKQNSKNEDQFDLAGMQDKDIHFSMPSETAKLLDMYESVKFIPYPTLQQTEN